MMANHRLHALYVLLAGTGLRIGEATGLRWEDIGGIVDSTPRHDPSVGLLDSTLPRVDGERGAFLTVTYQLQRIGGEHVLTDPKTDTAGRVVFLPPSVSEALRQHRVGWVQEAIGG